MTGSVHANVTGTEIGSLTEIDDLILRVSEMTDATMTASEDLTIADLQSCVHMNPELRTRIARLNVDLMMVARCVP